MHHSTRILLKVMLCLTLFSSCLPTRHVSDGKFLVDKTTIHTDDIKISKEQLAAIQKQKPNRRILKFFRFHLAVYNIANAGKETKLKNRVKETVGEEPVILDTILTSKTSRQMRLYLQKKGYFNAEVKDSTVLKKKRAHIHYYITANEPYLFRNLKYVAEDSAIQKMIMDFKPTSNISKGKIYDADMLSQERERITMLLNNNGYFHFTKEYIYFDVDTGLGSREVDVVMHVTNPNGFHKQYNINNIYIHTDFKPRDLSGPPADTVEYKGFYFIFNTPSSYKLDLIINNIKLKKGDQYSLKNQEETYRSLSSLKAFRFININYKELPDTTLLNVLIQLSPVLRQGLSAEAEGSYSGGNPGVAGNLVYQNKNLFGGAEFFDARIKAGLEIQQIDKKDENNVVIDKLPFNTIEFGPQVSLSIPKFIAPFRLENFIEHHRPKTVFTASYNLQQRPQYSRTLALGTFGYTWESGKFSSHQYNPIEINYVQIDLYNSEFEDRINLNAFTRNSYKDYFITAGKYTYIFNSQEIGIPKNFNFLRVNFEHSGNLLYLTKSVLGDSDSTFLGILFAQYVRPDFDFRHYQIITKNSTLVTRFFAGVGFAYLNSNVLPFQKNFFAGGPNSLRAWPSRSIGPGSIPNSEIVQFDQYGDMQIEGNLEYRFNIYKYIKGALFTDAGNIWLIRNDSLRPGGWIFKKDPDDDTGRRGQLDLNKFMGDLAVGSGAGIRLDFSFFILRVDLGFKIHDPSMEDPYVLKYIFNENFKENYRLNNNGRNYKFYNPSIGIGYPF